MKFGLFGVLGVALVVAGCGGGGSTPTSLSLTGRVLSVETGGPLNPAGSVQQGQHTALTSLADGSFVLAADSGAASMLVTTNVSGWPTFTYTFAAITATTDLGDLWVGPQQVELDGRVVDASSGAGISGAGVTFGGRTGKTDANGYFALANVAYSDTGLPTFWGIAGAVSATGYYATTFSAQPNEAASGVVTVNDVLMTPTSDVNPPPAPYNIWGRISPGALAPGTVVTLSQGGTAVRVYNVASDDVYYFWVAPGSYTISYANGTHTAPSVNVTLTASDQVIREDATLQ